MPSTKRALAARRSVLLKVKTYRPSPSEAIVGARAGARAVGVVARSVSFGWNCAPLYQDVAGALGRAGTQVLVTDAGNQVAVEPGGFTITGPNGATLRGTIFAPARATPTVADDTYKIEINYRFDHTNGTFTRKVISVAGDDNFLVVFTLQKGVAPPVTVEGDTVRIGQQTVRFDGEKTVLGRFAGEAPPPNSRATSSAPAGTVGSP